MKKSPIFILSCERSGSTLLQTLLDAHSQIAIPPESEFYHRFASTLPYYGDLSNRRRLEVFVADLLADWRIEAWELDVKLGKVIDRVVTPTPGGVVRVLFELYAQQKGATCWGEKIPSNLFHLD